MRLKVLGCKVLSRELGFLASSCNNYIDLTTLRQGLHDTPDLLRESLQKEIDLIDEGNDVHSAGLHYEEDFDAIILAYGLCCNGVMGLSSKRYPLVIPKAHDCITLFLGSREKYESYFNSHSGVYWYNRGWLENTPMPGKRRYEALRNIYVEHYGEENADYLMEMEQGWLTKYNWCTFIDWSEFKNEEFRKETRESAAYLNWEYDEISGSRNLLEDFLNGKWDDRFVIVPPGKHLVPSYDASVLKVEED